MTMTNTKEDTTRPHGNHNREHQRGQTGKLTKSQTGERNWTPYYIIGGLIADLVLIAFLFAGHH